MKSEINEFDFCIVGAGMIGSATALGLGQLGFKVAILEPKLPTAFDAEQGPDIRVSAINLSTEKLLQNLQAWSHIKAMRYCPYKRLSVWEKPNFRTDFNSADIQKSHLGHIIENRVIQLGLHQAIAKAANIELISGQSIQQLETRASEQSHIQLKDGRQILAKMLIGADGGQSWIRQQVGIGVQGWQYAQQALGILINTHSKQQDITWQQFTSNGPMAFLPLYNGFACLVWYHQPKKIALLKQLSKSKLKQQIQQHFPAELVDFEVLNTASFPLTRMHANQYFKGNTLLIGDAAHTINPLAGQGVNLGFKDVSALLKVITEALNANALNKVLKPEIHQQWLKQYESNRRKDNLLMMSTMDALYSGFSNSHLPIKFLRNVALKIAQHAGPIKNKAMQYAIGLDG